MNWSEVAGRPLLRPAAHWSIAAILVFLVLSLNAFLFEKRWLFGITGGYKVDSSEAVPVLLMNALFVLGVIALSRRLWIAVVLLMPVMLWVPAEWFYLLKFGSPTSAQSIGVIIESDPVEALSWLGKSGVAILLLIGGLGLVLAGWAVVLHRADLQWKHWTQWLFGYVLLPLIAALALLMGRDSAQSSVEGEWGKMLEQNPAGWPEALASSYPLGIFIRFFDFHQQTRLLASAAAPSSERFGVYQVSSDERQVYVLVIGESARADHLSLNGYFRETTPRLRKRGVISFSDFVSASSATRNSVPTFFFADAGNDLAHRYAQPSLIDAMREAGFKTYWLSTQAPFGKFDSPISAIARRADEVRFINPGDYRQKGIYDAQLLPLLEEVLSRGERRSFIVLHTLGSHADYRYRYPSEMAKFTPVLPEGTLPDPWDPAMKNYLVNAYDNSLLYMDGFVDSVIGVVDSQKSKGWVLYAADHGEGLFDGKCDKSGHGFPSSANHHAAMLFWPSEIFLKSNHVDVNGIAINSSGPADYRAVFHTILTLSGIESQRRREDMTLTSESYRPGARMVTVGNSLINFDRDMAKLDCANGH